MEQPQTTIPGAERINWNFIKERLDHCRANHESCTPRQREHWADFRLIDVDKKCLVLPCNNPRFVALSYVWGAGLEADTMQCTKANVRFLGQEGSLLSLSLPATISDAIEACTRLEERFLWVDRLCIIQDDAETKQHQIDHMESIFGCADFVLISTHGNDMHAGIAGISAKRKDQMVSRLFRTYVVGQQMHLSMAIAKSTWTTRGWTYQEAVLPSRRVWLTESWVYFECTQNTFSECAGTKTMSGGSEFTVRAPDSDNGPSRYSEYLRHLTAYVRRELTFQSDIINAFSGIATRLYPSSGFIYGLPCADFNQGLLWHRTRDLRYQSEATQHLKFPSWSWTSADGDRLSQSGNSFYGPLVQWTCWDTNGQLKLLRSADHSPTKWCSVEKESSSRLHVPIERNARFHLAIAVLEGCIASTLPISSLEEITIARATVLMQNIWPTYSSFWVDTFPENDIELDEKLFVEADNSKQKLIIGHAQTSVFQLRPKNVLSSTSDADEFDIYDLQGRHSGRLPSIPPKSLEKITKHQDSRFKFIALSMRHLEQREYLNLSHELDEHYFHGWDVRKKTIEKAIWNGCPDVTYFDKEGTPVLPPPAVDVMVLERVGKHWRRIGLGWIFLKRWVESGPGFGTVVLE